MAKQIKYGRYLHVEIIIRSSGLTPDILQKDIEYFEKSTH